MTLFPTTTNIYEILLSNLDVLFKDTDHVKFTYYDGCPGGVVYRETLERTLREKLDKIEKDNAKRREVNHDYRESFLAVVVPRFVEILKDAPDFGYTAFDILKLYHEKYEDINIRIGNKVYQLSPGSISNVLGTDMKDMVNFGYNGDRRRSYKLRKEGA